MGLGRAVNHSASLNSTQCGQLFDLLNQTALPLVECRSSGWVVHNVRKLHLPPSHDENEDVHEEKCNTSERGLCVGWWWSSVCYWGVYIVVREGNCVINVSRFCGGDIDDYGRSVMSHAYICFCFFCFLFYFMILSYYCPDNGGWLVVWEWQFGNVI